MIWAIPILLGSILAGRAIGKVWNRSVERQHFDRQVLRWMQGERITFTEWMGLANIMLRIGDKPRSEAAIKFANEADRKGWR
jgi:hypothetical protein